MERVTTDDLGHRIERSLNQIETAKTADEIWEHLLVFSQENAFEGICCKCFPSKGESNDEVFFSSTLNFSATVASFLRSLPSTDDVILLRALRSARPFRWNDVYNNEPQKLSKSKRNEAPELSVDAIVAPVFGPLIRNGYFVFLEGSERTANPGEENFIHILAQVSYLRLCELFFSAPENVVALSQRERDVIRYVAAGKSNSEIARKLGVSGRTVETYLLRIFDKLGVRDRVRASLRAYALGMLA